MTTTLEHQPPALADLYEAAAERCRRLKDHRSDQLAILLFSLVGELPADPVFCGLIDAYLEATAPARGVYATCGSCGQHGGHTLTCAMRPYSLGDDWIPCVRECTIGSQPDVIRNPAGRLEHLPAVSA